MNLFSWLRKKEDMSSPTKHPRTSPKIVDFTESLQVNSTLTKGLYHNSYPGMKLAGSLAYNPIAVPVTFMGIPKAEAVDNEKVTEQLKLLVEKMRDRFADIHRMSNREGTIWIYPKFSQGQLVWEFIEDDAITDIVKDLTTDKVIRLESREQITISLGNGNTKTINRTRIWTEKQVSVVYDSAMVNSYEAINPAGVLPIPFSNNADGNETRGHSDYDRIVSDLKAYHDIDLAEQNILAKYTPKMLQTVKDVNAFAKNNGFASASDMFDNLDISTIDLVISQFDEKTEFAFPVNATESYIKAKKQRFHKIIEGSGIPEIAWGLKTEGNMASVEENMQMLMNFVAEKQAQKVEAYKVLFKASLLLLNKARIINEVPDVNVTWNTLNGLSAKTKSEIFKNFCEGLSKIIPVSGITKDQVWKLWRLQYPDTTEEDFDDFKEGLNAMITHNVESKSTLEERSILNGVD